MIPKPEVRTLENVIDNEPVRVIHMLIGDPSDWKGKNKRAPENVLSIYQ